MRAILRRRHRRWPPGGILTYATDRLHEEIAYIAYHFHWPLDQILDLEHPQRHTYLTQISTINRRITEGT
ncbi:hypothetical protein HPO96_34530 [Kribbella sandramycini]|uniref:DUF6760 domain-containing protein n=1 Tax=Kribbella sandramycini TaxID=60450 RepID=A0A7Y4P2I0_9ACTN|nr:DUF6760 family protein [Kribbella sandramycini]MBB6570121.1 hypothetical protein [Kribbella sandramycini]NOL45377.1 hypothetical protein [Kribbella sandramycini]